VNLDRVPRPASRFSVVTAGVASIARGHGLEVPTAPAQVRLRPDSLDRIIRSVSFRCTIIGRVVAAARWLAARVWRGGLRAAGPRSSNPSIAMVVTRP
jgi:hypothetical protein